MERHTGLGPLFAGLCRALACAFTGYTQPPLTGDEWDEACCGWPHSAPGSSLSILAALTVVFFTIGEGLFLSPNSPGSGDPSCHPSPPMLHRSYYNGIIFLLSTGPLPFKPPGSLPPFLLSCVHLLSILGFLSSQLLAFNWRPPFLLHYLSSLFSRLSAAEQSSGKWLCCLRQTPHQSPLCVPGHLQTCTLFLQVPGLLCLYSGEEVFWFHFISFSLFLPL